MHAERLLVSISHSDVTLSKLLTSLPQFPFYKRGSYLRISDCICRQKKAYQGELMYKLPSTYYTKLLKSFKLFKCMFEYSLVMNSRKKKKKKVFKAMLFLWNIELFKACG